MNRHTAGLLPTAAVIIVTALAGCSDSKRTASVPPVQLRGVPLVEAVNSDVDASIDVVGTVRARTSAMVSARIPGTVSVLHVREGDRVRKGQLLARLESQESSANASAAMAAIDEAKRGLDEALAHRKLADATFARFKMLYDEQALTRQEFESHQTQRELAHQGVARAEARLRQVQESARAAGTMADYSKIIAPISGIITTKQADLGATVFPGQPLMIIDDEGSYQLELAVPESYAAKIRPGSAVKVNIDAVQRQINAKVAEVVPAADPGSRTFTAKVNVSSAGLKSGMFGRANIALGAKEKMILLPKGAVFERGNLTAVWVLDKNSIARMRLVKVGRVSGNQFEIISGLTVGEKVVADQVAKVSEGVKIEP